MNELLLKKFANPRWRLNNLYTIINKDKRTVKFQENYFQTIVNDYTLNNGKKKLILKPRQIGFSTNELLIMLDDCCFNRNRTNVIISHEQDSIEKLFRIIQTAYKHMDTEIRPILDKGGGSKYEYYFPDINSRIYTDLEVRSDTVSRLHVSEAAFAKQERLKASLESVPLNGYVTFETTANGMGNYFYERWQEVGSEYKKFFFPWYLHKEYQIPTDTIKEFSEDEQKLKAYVKKQFDMELTNGQINWRRQKKMDLKDLFLQEYPEDDITCFLTSGYAVFDLLNIAEQKKEAENFSCIEHKLELTQKGDYGTCYSIFKERKNDKKYVISADTAEGVGNDWSVATVFDVDAMEQVALIRGQWKPYDFAHKVNALAKRYNTTKYGMPHLVVESNNHGHAVLLELKQHIKYPDLFEYAKDRPGWRTDSVTRPIMVDTFINGVENKTILLHDVITYQECLTLVNKNGKIEAADSKHDDCIMACAIAIQRAIELKKIINIGKIYI